MDGSLGGQRRHGDGGMVNSSRLKVEKYRASLQSPTAFDWGPIFEIDDDVQIKWLVDP